MIELHVWFLFFFYPSPSLERKLEGFDFSPFYITVDYALPVLDEPLVRLKLNVLRAHGVWNGTQAVRSASFGSNHYNYKLHRL